LMSLNLFKQDNVSFCDEYLLPCLDVDDLVCLASLSRKSRSFFDSKSGAKFNYVKLIRQLVEHYNRGPGYINTSNSKKAADTQNAIKIDDASSFRHCL